MFQKLPLSPLERVDMVSDATIGYIYSYTCPFLMMEAVSEILEMYSVMTWLTACKYFSAPYVVGLVFYFYLCISFFQLPFHHKLVSAVLSPKNCSVCFGSWKTEQNSIMQCLSPGRCRVLYQIARFVVFFIASYNWLAWSRGSVLAFSTQVCGFKPGRSCRIFRAKKSSAHLPSEGK